VWPSPEQLRLGSPGPVEVVKLDASPESWHLTCRRQVPLRRLWGSAGTRPDRGCLDESPLGREFSSLIGSPGYCESASRLTATLPIGRRLADGWSQRTTVFSASRQQRLYCFTGPMESRYSARRCHISCPECQRGLWTFQPWTTSG